MAEVVTHYIQKIGSLFSQHWEIFKKAGKLNDEEIDIHAKTAAKSTFKKAKHPPCSLSKKKIESKSECLEKGDIIEKTNLLE